MLSTLCKLQHGFVWQKRILEPKSQRKDAMISKGAAGRVRQFTVYEFFYCDGLLRSAQVIDLQRSCFSPPQASDFGLWPLASGMWCQPRFATICHDFPGFTSPGSNTSSVPGNFFYPGIARNKPDYPGLSRIIPDARLCGPANKPD